ncbi:MAG TPA: ABC transporter ATP-binding protein [Acidimicrobiales bacterium]|jgi:ABC-2 type transport system ATP-binding protein
MPAVTRDVVVRSTDLVVRYDQLRAVDGLSFSASAGEVVVLLGPNGAGKSSTFGCVMGYRRPSSGSLRVLGLDPVAAHRHLVPRVGVLLQQGGVYPMLGPRAALRLFARYYRRPDDPERLLELLGLGAAARTPWRHLSGGEQRRLGLALALVGRPEVLVLDEPTAGVDPEGRRVVRSVIDDARRAGSCVLLSTHELPEAEHLADRVVVIDHGRAVAEGTPGELARSAGRDQVAFGAPPGLDTAALGAALGRPVHEVDPGRYRVDAAGSPALTAALATWLAARGAELTELHTGRSLEEAYLALVEHSAPGPEGP